MIHHYEFTIPGTPACVGEARAVLASFLAGAGLPVPAVDDALVACSELVTNAVLYSASGLEGGQVTVRAEVVPDAWARVDVVDQGPRHEATSPRPMTKPAGQQASGLFGECGRGLFIVAGLAGEIGDYVEDGLHAVWFTIRCRSCGQGVGRHG